MQNKHKIWPKIKSTYLKWLGFEQNGNYIQTQEVNIKWIRNGPKVGKPPNFDNWTEKV